MKNSFFTILIYWNDNRIHLGLTKKLIFFIWFPPLIYVSEIARQLTYVTFEWSHFGQTKALSCIFLTHFAIPCVRVVAWMWSSGRKWCQRCELTFTFLFKRPSAPLFVHVLHSLYALESFRINNRNKNISTRRRAFTINSQKIRSKEVFP